MINLEINDLEFLVKSNLSVLEACKIVGIIIPRFCYHEILSVAGNCRVCLVEISNSPKPVASCALPVLNNMKIFIETPLVKKARANVFETLLLNHPLDCPICDQGGECDLQDQAKVFGGYMQRFFFAKRSVEDKYCGPIIKTIMTRCIHCTRCVRFSSEIAGTGYFGTLNRGGSTEIGPYLAQSFNSELSGNVIDLCPVGALTSKPYAFKARPWELRTVESIDPTDSFGSNTYINYKESEIVRITPKINTELNNHLISDKTRFSYDAQTNQRLTVLFSYNDKVKSFVKEKWLRILPVFKATLSNEKKSLFLINNELDMETGTMLNLLSFKYGVRVRNINNKNLTPNFFISHLFNKINDANKVSSVCFILSANLQIETTLLNARLRLKHTNENFTLFGAGQHYRNNLSLQYINLSFKKLLSVFEGKNLILSRILLAFKNPILCIGENTRRYGLTSTKIHQLIKALAPTATILNIVQSCNTEGIAFLNNKPMSKNDGLKTNAQFFLNLDNTHCAVKVFKLKNLVSTFWFNTHMSELALKMSTLVPILSEFEEEKIIVNMEQRPQKCLKVFAGTGDTRSLKDFLSLLLNENTKARQDSFLNFNRELLKNPQYFQTLKQHLVNMNLDSGNLLLNNSLVFNSPIKALFTDFYQSNKLTKNSLLMSKCSQEMRKAFTNFLN